MATKPWVLLVWLYGLLALVPLAWRDEAPLAVFATQWVLTVAAWPLRSYFIPIGLTVALYAVSVHHNRRVSLLALLASSIPIGLDLAGIYSASSPGHAPLEAFITNGALLVLGAGWAWGLGRVTQANQRRLHDLERERESAREAEVLSTERRRIARELHDIVSHAVTVIVLQAAGAARVAKTDLTQVIQSLTNIETTGKKAMAELRRLLGVLEDSDPTSDAASTGEFKPQPGLADLPELLTSFHDSGMPVTVQTEGTPRELDSSIDLTVYRIVQEGLLNVLKHAGKQANPRLRLAWESHSLLIQIDNTTTATKATQHPGQTCPGGRGLVGLRERALAAGGNLQAGPHRQGGYRLTATIPLAMPAGSSVPSASGRGRGDQGKVSA